DRRGALRQAGPRPRDRRAAGGAIGLPDEDAAEAVHRRPGPPASRGVRRGGSAAPFPQARCAPGLSVGCLLARARWEGEEPANPRNTRATGGPSRDQLTPWLTHAPHLRPRARPADSGQLAE